MSENTAKKVLIITYYWPPAGGPGVQRWLKFSRYLPEFGVEPIILTVDENKASYAFRDDSLQDEVSSDLEVYRTHTREFYSMYLKFTGRKNIPFSGFVQESKPVFKEKVIRFLRTHLFIPDPRKGWNRYAYKKAKELVLSGKIQHIVTTGPPHSSHLIGLKLKKKFPELNWVSDFRDPWTHIFFFEQLNHSPYSLYRHKKLEKKVLQKSNKVIVVGHSMRDGFLKDYTNLDKSKIRIIPNGYDEEDFQGDWPEREEDFVITYAGTLAGNYPIEALVNSIKTLKDEYQITVILRLIGEVNSGVRAQINKILPIEQVEYIQRVTHAKVINYLFRSSIQLLIIPNAPGNKSILTGKIFEYMASGRPILGIGPPDGDAAKVLSETETGSMFDYSMDAQITAFLIAAKKNRKKSLLLRREAIKALYERKSLSGQLAEILAELDSE